MFFIFDKMIRMFNGRNFLLLFLMMSQFQQPVFACSIIDTLLPKMDSVVVKNANTLVIYYSNSMDLASTTDLSHYRVQPGNVAPVSVSSDNGSSRKWMLNFSDSFSLRKLYNLHITQVSDAYGQMISDTSVFFFRYQSDRNDILIHEIMSDPEPRIGLPAIEWIELVNASPFPINVSGWRMAKPNSRSGPLPDFKLMPDSFLLVCSSGSLPQLVSYGNTRSVSYFPALSNSGDELFLLDDKGKTIHSVSYSDRWHENEVKKSGGWSLEMMDQKNPCGGYGNWSSAVSASGGTPGKSNSIRQVNPDHDPPSRIKAYVSEPTKVCLLFNETLDSTTAMNPLNYQIDDQNIHIADVSFESPKQDGLTLMLSRSLDSEKLYSIAYDEMKDCVMNGIGSSDPVKIGIKKLPDSMDLVINEILFNPVSGGADMVELYNRTDRVIDLQDCYLANLNELGEVDDITSISENPFPLLPQEYLALSTDKTHLLRQYRSCNPDQIIEIPDLPSFADDEGNVLLLSKQGKEIDRVHYFDDWHFSLLNEKEGVSLERLDPNGFSQHSANWHSASSASGFATPGNKNSQAADLLFESRAFSLKSRWMSPNNDGNEDLLVLQYSFNEPGNVLQTFICDAGGRIIKKWLRAEMCGRTGKFFWNGMLDAGQKVGYGAYILFVEAFNTSGNIRREKLVFYVGD